MWIHIINPTRYNRDFFMSRVRTEKGKLKQKNFDALVKTAWIMHSTILPRIIEQVGQHYNRKEIDQGCRRKMDQSAFNWSYHTWDPPWTLKRNPWDWTMRSRRTLNASLITMNSLIFDIFSNLFQSASQL